MMRNGDREGRIFLFHPHTNKRFLLTTKYLIFIEEKNMKEASKNPEYAEMRHGDISVT